MAEDLDNYHEQRSRRRVVYKFKGRRRHDAAAYPRRRALGDSGKAARNGTTVLIPGRVVFSDLLRATAWCSRRSSNQIIFSRRALDPSDRARPPCHGKRGQTSRSERFSGAEASRQGRAMTADCGRMIGTGTHGSVIAMALPKPVRYSMVTVSGLRCGLTSPIPA